MHDPRLSEALPELLREGLLTPEQAERIRARYQAGSEQAGNRQLLVFAILGSLLVGLGIILIIAHNWDDLSRPLRTLLAFAPVLLGQGLVWYTLRHKSTVTGWREGSAVLLACGLCACVALISQIYHIHGELSGYLLTCGLLIAPLLYLPGSFVVALGYLALVVWHATLVRTDGPSELPWMALPLLAAYVPFHLHRARHEGGTVGFWWLNLFAALAFGILSQLFYREWTMLHVLALVALSAAYTLVPWLVQRPELRTWPWVLVGGLAQLVLFFIFSFRPVWEELLDERTGHLGGDLVSITLLLAIGLGAYIAAARRRRLLERWPYPEGFVLFLIAYVVGLSSPALAAVLINLALLAMGVITVRHGIEQGSLRRMNLGLSVLSLTILLRFFDTDLSFVVRGLVFIAIGAGFLYMNLRLVRQRQRHGNTL
jgi:uncharacterized membrane protein